MNAIQGIARGFRKLGYRDEAIFRDYKFDDMSTPSGNVRTARMVAFTQTPPSYRSAAFGVAEAHDEDIGQLVDQYRALGTPLFFVVEGKELSVWQIFGGSPARMLERLALDGLDALFEENKLRWAPEAIHRAKAIGKFDASYQLDFVDIGLLPAIEGQIHSKLDRLLNEVFEALSKPKDRAVEEQHAFQGVFRLLAAKILIDRGHASAKQWNAADVVSVLNGIGEYYNLPSEKAFTRRLDAAYFRPAWEKLHSSFNVANISADDLAYVYENTLVTPAAREQFGTHSTPRQVADFIAARLRLWEPAAAHLKVYEPFCGAGVLLVSALRHLSMALPATWTEKQRHAHLVKHLRGSELDAFACEVATLSLILADYPNTNGWKIDNEDLFDKQALAEQLTHSNVIICNPPFEPLTAAEKTTYPDFAAVGGNKAEAVLRLTLTAKPAAIGFVLPRSFLMDRAYRWHRQEIERTYSDIEIVSLPDRVFTISQAETALVIARGHASKGAHQRIIASEVDDRGRKAFLEIGETSRVREDVRTITSDASGEIWLAPLSALWARLKRLPTLGDFVDCHWGVRWKNKKQAHVASQAKRPGAVRGVVKLQDHRQFVVGKWSWIDFDRKGLYGGGDLPWGSPKILCNAIRSSRGAWRISAAVDRTGLVASQQFAVLWPQRSNVDLDAVAAVINGPVGNAFLRDHSADRRLRIATFLKTPMPANLPAEIGNLARQYARLVSKPGPLFGSIEDAQRLVDQIDASILDAYSLPPRFVRALLASFGDEERPLVHAWRAWNVKEDDPALTLSELRASWVQSSQGDWTHQLKPIENLEADVAAEMWGPDK